jgi:UDP-GlcNAc:undecaprenyl-phosphate GlcNAc-1-phosphate transferase
VNFIAGVDAAIPPIVATFVVAAVLAFVLTPVVRRLAHRHGVIDRPDARRVNVVPIPRGGGLAVAAAFLAVAAVFLYLNDREGLVPSPVFLTAGNLVALLLGGALAAALGALDDYYDLRARWQFLNQVILAGLAVALGIGVTVLNNPFGPGVIRLEGIFAIGFTMFWIVGMINSINWIDGLDGLSSGIGVIAAVTLGMISLTTQVGQPLIAVLCFALAGSLVGFLCWNFHPASIFVGTSGVQFIGFSLAILSILGSAKVAVALLVLGVPIIDTFWIIVRRITERRSPFSPDRSHIHHRLLDLGLTHRQAVVLIYAICAALGVLALFLSGINHLYAFLGVFIAFGLVLVLPTRGSFRAEELEAGSYEDEPYARPSAAAAPTGAGRDSTPGTRPGA